MAQSRNFGIIGAAGYVAPRHMKAIVDTGNKLVAATDPFDSVGIIDRYAPEASFFTEFERFDRHAEKLRRMGEADRLHYISVCSPNYLHDAHCRFALRIGADAICEKPLVLNPWNVDALQDIENETGQKIYNVLQLRMHPSVIRLKKQVEAEPTGKRFDIDLTYIASRGKWYFISWKGDESKSGGVATNIGVHFFDMLMWIFGSELASTVTHRSAHSMKGELTLENADVTWHLSVDKNDLPAEAGEKTTWRSLTLDGEAFEFSDGFTDLHTAVYQDILNGGGYGLADARPAIELVHRIRGG
ncbi:MAG: Gfo/Idh/MocA family oxidoreductase [Rhodothermales bacterium]|nr:Gfo/Idh/MocA family oxidoreductase [Rhodothermales bacterium]MDG2016268.1 Gfo/Idh/MocA family oxidoreductase [Rhodothermales bacterium]HAY36969.1 oxidoreductase [Bacteroidota bacterium]